MRPVLFELFGVEVASYAASMALGYVAALWVVMRQTRRAPSPGALDRDQVWDLFIVMLVSSLVGAKLGHVLFESPGHALQGGRVAAGIGELLEADPWHWARLGESGYVWYGGLIGALATAVVYFVRRPALDAWLYADAFAELDAPAGELAGERPPANPSPPRPPASYAGTYANAYWGPATSSAASQRADLNRDGYVNADDLGYLLSRWGSVCTN